MSQRKPPGANAVTIMPSVVVASMVNQEPEMALFTKERPENVRGRKIFPQVASRLTESVKGVGKVLHSKWWKKDQP